MNLDYLILWIVGESEFSGWFDSTLKVLPNYCCS